MLQTQRLRSGLLVRQDFFNCVRFPFFASNTPEHPFWTPGGTIFVVGFRGRPYALTCGHILDQGGCGNDLIVSSTKFGNKAISHRTAHRPLAPDSSPLDADLGDVVVLEFDSDVVLSTFESTAYIVDDNTVCTSKHGEFLVVHGALNKFSTVDGATVSPSFSTFEFDDVGATSADPYLRQGEAKYQREDFTSLTGLSGSPVFNASQSRMCGMVVRGGRCAENTWRIWYVDMADIVKLLTSVHEDTPKVSYIKNVERRRTPC